MYRKVFNLFQRLHRQEDVAGTGIGLAIVKKSVELLKGSIELTSSSDRGSTFTVNLLSSRGES